MIILKIIALFLYKQRYTYCMIRCVEWFEDILTKAGSRNCIVFSNCFNNPVYVPNFSVSLAGDLGPLLLFKQAISEVAQLTLHDS